VNNNVSDFFNFKWAVADGRPQVHQKEKDAEFTRMLRPKCVAE